MDKDYFIKLLDKYQHGKITNEEEQFLINYYNLFDNKPDIMEMLTSEQKEELKNNIQNSMWSNILRRKAGNGKLRVMDKLYVKVSAAAIVFALVFASVFY